VCCVSIWYLTQYRGTYTRCPGPYGSHVNLNSIIIIIIIVVPVGSYYTGPGPQRYISARNMRFFSLNMDVRLGNVSNSRTERTGVVKTISPKLYTICTMLCVRNDRHRTLLQCSRNLFFTHPPQPTSRYYQLANRWIILTRLSSIN